MTGDADDIRAFDDVFQFSNVIRVQHVTHTVRDQISSRQQTSSSVSVFLFSARSLFLCSFHSDNKEVALVQGTGEGTRVIKYSDRRLVQLFVRKNARAHME